MKIHIKEAYKHRNITSLDTPKAHFKVKNRPVENEDIR